MMKKIFLVAFFQATALQAAVISPYQTAIQAVLPHVQGAAPAETLAQLSQLDFQTPLAVLKPLIFRLELHQGLNVEAFQKLSFAQRREALGLVIQDEVDEAQDSAATLLARYDEGGKARSAQGAARRQGDLTEAEDLLTTRHAFLSAETRQNLSLVHASLSAQPRQALAEARAAATGATVTRYFNSPAGAPPAQPFKPEIFGDRRAPRIWETSLSPAFNMHQVVQRLEFSGAVHPDDIAKARAALKEMLELREADAEDSRMKGVLRGYERILGITPALGKRAPKMIADALEFEPARLVGFCKTADIDSMQAEINALLETHRSQFKGSGAAIAETNAPGISFFQIETVASSEAVAKLREIIARYVVDPPSHL